jgi:sterol desaturase/sphingolipid hydroxylase (fatty acid hydroxylase superfamily)
VTSLAVVYLGLALLAPLLALIERSRPAARGARTRRAVAIDLAYWLVTPLLTGTFARALALGVVAALGMALGFGADGPSFLARVRAVMPLGHLPVWASLPVTLLFADLLGYVSHRLRHRGALWYAHAVHHGASELRAITAARLHPFDETLDTLFISVPLLLLGTPFGVFAALGPLFVLHTLLVHANVDWSFGPLGRVLASPRFHRRHHARDLPPANYGGVFAFYDVIFGTFEMPEADPGVFGVADAPVPESLLGQLVYPVRRLVRR